MFRFASIVVFQVAALFAGDVARAMTVDRLGADLPRSSDIREGRFLLAPQAFVLFCDKNPGDCSAAPSPSALTLDTPAWDRLKAVNVAVNRAITPVSLVGADVWALDRHEGHCAIFAVQKRHDLIAAGVPAAALSLAVVYTSVGESHLVLVVRTDHGAFVLDNLRDRILPWQAAGYQFAKIQSKDNPTFWVSVSGADRNSASLVVASHAAPRL